MVNNLPVGFSGEWGSKVTRAQPCLAVRDGQVEPEGGHRAQRGAQGVPLDHHGGWIESGKLSVEEGKGECGEFVQRAGSTVDGKGCICR